MRQETKPNHHIFVRQNLHRPLTTTCRLDRTFIGSETVDGHLVVVQSYYETPRSLPGWRGIAIPSVIEQRNGGAVPVQLPGPSSVVLPSEAEWKTFQLQGEVTILITSLHCVADKLVVAGLASYSTEDFALRRNNIKSVTVPPADEVISSMWVAVNRVEVEIVQGVAWNAKLDRHLCFRDCIW